ncbi:hypothetical protein FOMPIDRAFT_1027623 [Fomitopsis schrenkii]|uniref:Transmembrane protein n=1 Tax=Fomitopsis schrenkii TaxID=2126942 RepID=S8EPH0_FOMSC|nr:hypothetical protein FOMPIDRAFT_1027623 [Fomitopsis schrenkii]
MSSGWHWNFTIDDSSSFITYKPFEDGGLGNRTLIGWEPFWSDSGGFPTGFANGSSGQSHHITALDGASFSFQFYGNAVYLHGTTNGTIDVTIDNGDVYSNQPAMSNGLLYYADNLATQTHYVTLTAHFTHGAGQVMEFDLANVTYAFTGGAPVAVSYSNTNGSAFQYTGNWSIDSAPDVPSPTSTAPYHITSQYGSAVSMNFTGGEAVAVYGLRDWGDWIYNVSLDGFTTQYNGSTPWKQGDSLLFFQAGLDPNQTHTLVLTDEANQSYWNLMLNSVSVFQTNRTLDGGTASNSSSTSPSTAPNAYATKSTNTGAIAGGVIGGVAGLLLVICLLIWLFRRQPHKRPVDASPYPILPVVNSHSSDSLKYSPAVGPDAVHIVGVPPIPAGMYRKGAPISRPATTQVPVSAPATVLSASPPSSTEPPTVSNVETATAPAQMDSAASNSASAPPPIVPVAPTVDVDRIIELIAQRIDRGPPRDTYDDDAPPCYPESMIQ